MQLTRPIRTRFRYGYPTRVNLATQRKLAGSFFKRHAVTQNKSRLRRIVGARFQVLFHSPPGVLFTFPSRYWSAIGHQGVFRLDGWSRQIHTEFQGFRVTWETHIRRQTLTTTGLSPSTVRLSSQPRLHICFLTPRTTGRSCTTRPTTPRMQPLPGITHTWFSLIRFRSPLLSESLLFSLPTGTEMFHFPAFPPHTLYIQVQVTRHDSC